MFTGLVERTASVAGAAEVEGNRRLFVRIDAGRPALRPWQPSTTGESISVSGVCLTVVEVEHDDSGGEVVSFDVIPETLGKTTLGTLQAGDAVNLERSLRVGDPIGGHFVTGHVDGRGEVRRRESRGGEVLFVVGAAGNLLDSVLPKGSIAVDGVSLTVIDVQHEPGGAEAGWFSFAAIPHTLELTTLRDRHPGDGVNLEADLISKHISKHIAATALQAAMPDDKIARLIDARIKTYLKDR